MKQNKETLLWHNFQDGLEGTAEIADSESNLSTGSIIEEAEHHVIPGLAINGAMLANGAG